jgi:hypothetical protein
MVNEMIHTPFGLLETRDNPCVCLENPFAQTCDVVDGFIVKLQTKPTKVLSKPVPAIVRSHAQGWLEVPLLV